MSVEDLAIENVVNGCGVIGAAQDWNTKMALTKEDVETLLIRRLRSGCANRNTVHIDAQGLQSLDAPAGIVALEHRQTVLAVSRLRGPEVEQYRFASQLWKRSLLA